MKVSTKTRADGGRRAALLGTVGASAALVLGVIVPATAQPGGPTSSEPAPNSSVAPAAVGGAASAAESSDVQAADGSLLIHVPEISDWEMTRTGTDATASGFAPGASITISLNGEVAGSLTADEDGQLGFTLTSDVGPGEHTVTVASSDITVEAMLTVIADSDWYSPSDEPWMISGDRIFTADQLDAGPLEVSVFDFPDEAAIDIVLNGEVLETARAGIIGGLDYDLSESLALGSHSLQFVHPVATLTWDFTVVSGEHGTPPPVGAYEGTALQVHTGKYPDEDPTERPFSFDVNDDGAITEVTGEYSWICIGLNGELLGMGTNDFADFPIPATPITADEPFEITWDDDDYTIFGTVASNGTASGDIEFDHGACGSTILEWETALDGEIPDPSPTPTSDPDPSPSPTATEDPDPSPTPTTDPDPTPTATDEPDPSPTPTDGPDPSPTPTDGPDPSPTPTDQPDPSPTSTLDPDPSPSPTDQPDPSPTSDPDPQPDPSDTPDPDPAPSEDPDPSPDTIPVTTPSEDDLDAALEGTISAPSEAAAGDTISIGVDGVEDGTDVGVWLFSEATYLGTHSVTDGAVAVTIPDGTSPGEHSLGVWSAPDILVGWDTLAVVEDDAGTDDDSDDGGGTDNGSDGGRDDSSDRPGDNDGSSDSSGSGDSTRDGADDRDGDLPRTGSSSLGAPIALGTMLIAGGAALVVWMRRRTSGTA